MTDGAASRLTAAVDRWAAIGLNDTATIVLGNGTGITIGDVRHVVAERDSLREQLARFTAALSKLTPCREDDVEVALTKRIVARILRIAAAQTDPHPEIQAFRRGLLLAAGEAKVAHLYEPDDSELAQ